MTDRTRRAAEFRTLLARLSQQRKVLGSLESRLERASSRASGADDPESVAAAALYLQHIYTAIEDTFLRIANDLDGAVPSGSDWHRLLAEQMTLQIPEIRPALLNEELAQQLDILRKFRHRVRHAYDQEYEWDKMTEPLRAWERTSLLLPEFFEGVTNAVRDIIAALEKGGAGDEDEKAG